MPKLRRLVTPAIKTLCADGKKINWYPGHMKKGLEHIISKLSTVDCILEIHDARIPFSGRNREFRQQLGVIKPHILLLNKRDLTDLSKWDSIKSRLQAQGDENIMLTDLSGSCYNLQERGYTDLGQKILESVTKSSRYNRENAEHYRVMIVGIPNVGKSTLINRLRQHYLGIKGEPAAVGPNAGVTRHVTQNIKIVSNPPVYIIDTPGILNPSSLKSIDQGFKVALCSSINDALVNIESLAKYLLEFLNKNNITEYTVMFGMNKPASCLEELVSYGAHHLRKINEVSVGSEKIYTPDVDTICWKFVKEFRKGNFGKVMLDEIDVE